MNNVQPPNPDLDPCVELRAMERELRERYHQLMARLRIYEKNAERFGTPPISLVASAESALAEWKRVEDALRGAGNRVG